MGVMLATPRHTAVGLLVLRVALGGFMLVHGLQKVAHFTALSETFPDPVGLGSLPGLVMAIGAEVGCSVLLILGLLTRLAVVPLALTMGVATFIVHGADPWKVKELSALFLAAYIALFCTGPGPYAVDRWLWRHHDPERAP